MTDGSLDLLELQMVQYSLEIREFPVEDNEEKVKSYVEIFILNYVHVGRVSKHDNG